MGYELGASLKNDQRGLLGSRLQTFSRLASGRRSPLSGVGWSRGWSSVPSETDFAIGPPSTHDEVERLAASQGVDIVLTHAVPAGVCFHRHRRGAGYRKRLDLDTEVSGQNGMGVCQR